MCPLPPSPQRPAKHTPLNGGELPLPSMSRWRCSVFPAHAGEPLRAATLPAAAVTGL